MLYSDESNRLFRIILASRKFDFNSRYDWRKFRSLRVKYRWKYGKDERNCIRCAEQAGRNESAVVAGVLNQTRNIPHRACAMDSARTCNTISRQRSRWIMASPFQASRVANSGRNFARVSGPKSCFAKTTKSVPQSSVETRLSMFFGQIPCILNCSRYYTRGIWTFFLAQTR